MDLRALTATLAFAAACSGTPPPASEPPPAPPSTIAPVAEPATSPCAVDTDCQMYSGPACSCRVALTSATVTPDPTPCFVAPCMNREAYCDAATHACMVRRATPPPTTSVAPSLDDVPATS